MSAAGRLATAAGAATAYTWLVQGKLTLDTGLGRRVRTLSCPPVDIAAPRPLVYAVLTAPYAVRQPRAMAEKVRVLERGSDLVLAAHRTPVRGGLVATTVETVRMVEPERIEFRLVRGPVPHVQEAFELTEIDPADGGPTRTRVDYTGTLGTDFWRAGEWWGTRVAAAWESAVAASLATAKAEAERRAPAAK